MNGLLSPFRQLIEHKLWPFALLLVAALVAVPVVLSKDAEVPAPAPAATAGAAAALASQSPTQPIVSLGEPAERESRRRVLGARKNPFQPVKVKKPSIASSAPTTTQVPAPQTTTGSGAPATSRPPLGGLTPPVRVTPPVVVRPRPVPVTAPVTTRALYRVKVRIQQSGGQPDTRVINRLTGLPAMSNARAQFLGLRDKYRKAVFLVRAGQLVLGDGFCRPSPQDCKAVELREDETAFLVDGDDTFVITVVNIGRKTTTSVAKALAQRSVIARGGRDLLRTFFSRLGGYRYSRASGSLRLID